MLRCPPLPVFIAPGARVISVAQLRPLIGISRICGDSITRSISAFVRFRASAVALTCTEFRDGADLEAPIQSSHLPEEQIDAGDLLGFEAILRDRDRVCTDSQ